MRAWPSPAAIQARPVDFIRQSQSVVRVMGQRIRAENESRYAMVDGLR